MDLNPYVYSFVRALINEVNAQRVMNSSEPEIEAMITGQTQVITDIDTIGNAYGCLVVIQDGDGCYWGVSECTGKVDWELISNHLYDCIIEHITPQANPNTINQSKR